ncbi:hypothetical protein SSX86_007176 [Deinandra increscens subsp. villosa]|uniref:Uncharacterized protein n=1 Tax=Deinandra increscens subsp. villosa TaxID=3103831 RepID=A0AAP0H4H3_9ASTR
MKNFLSTTSRREVFSLMLLFTLLIIVISSTNTQKTSLHDPLYYHYGHSPTTTTISDPKYPLRSLPRHHTKPSMLEEIDPRYGVAKRLVPSGPNPLHNWHSPHV